MLQGKYVLFAWSTYYPNGGLNDCCGWFEDANFAWDFFKNSSHCATMDHYQIVNVATWKVVQEGDYTR